MNVTDRSVEDELISEESDFELMDKNEANTIAESLDFSGFSRQNNIINLNEFKEPYRVCIVILAPPIEFDREAFLNFFKNNLVP